MKLFLGIVLFASFVGTQASENCSEEYLCKDDRVNYGTKVGTVKEVFSNGNAQIKFDGDDNFSYLQVRGLGKGVPCVGEICKGDRVNYGTVSGKVEEVFTNGRAKIKLDEQKEYAFNMTVRLGKSFECIENLCRGSKIGRAHV